MAARIAIRTKMIAATIPATSKEWRSTLAFIEWIRIPKKCKAGKKTIARKISSQKVLLFIFSHQP